MPDTIDTPTLTRTDIQNMPVGTTFAWPDSGYSWVRREPYFVRDEYDEYENGPVIVEEYCYDWAFVNREGREREPADYTHEDMYWHYVDYRVRGAEFVLPYEPIIDRLEAYNA